MKLLFFLGVSLILAFPVIERAVILEKVKDNATDPATFFLLQDALANVTGNVSYIMVNMTGRNATGAIGQHNATLTGQQVTLIKHNVTLVLFNATDALVKNVSNVTHRRSLSSPNIHDRKAAPQDNVTVPKSYFGGRIRNLTSHNVTNTTSHVTPAHNASFGRKLLQVSADVNKTEPQKKVSLLKDYETETSVVKNSSTYSNIEKFWEDVKKWALDSNQIECKDLMEKWFDGLSSVQISGLPTSFVMIRNNTAMCKIIKQTVIPKSVFWQIDFFNDLTANGIGSLWIGGQAVDKLVQLPDQLEFVFHIQFDPSTDKIIQLEIVPVEPDAIYEAVASKPVKSFHNVVRTAMQEGFDSPKFLNLLSDKFVLEASNLFLGNPGAKRQFNKTELKEFLDQDVNIFEFDDAKLEGFSIPFFDDRSVVSEVRFDQLPIKANGFRLEGVKFWLTHIFDCKDNSSSKNVSKDNVTIIDVVPTNTSKVAYNQTAFTSKNSTKADSESYCLLEKVHVTVNRPISLLAQLVPFDFDENRNARQEKDIAKDENTTKH